MVAFQKTFKVHVDYSMLWFNADVSMHAVARVSPSTNLAPSCKHQRKLLANHLLVPDHQLLTASTTMATSKAVAKGRAYFGFAICLTCL